MNCLFSKIGRLSFFFIILLTIYSCKKEGSIDEQNESLQSVTFKISGFSSSDASLKASGVKNQAQSNTKPSNVQNYIEGYLYFWSFNAENLDPDIAYQKDLSPIITSDGTNSYVGGYSFENYEAISSLSIKGATEVVVKLPIGGVEKITQFGFDTGSSDTGPKDFEIYYSIDEGVKYEVLEATNQFLKNGEGAPKNSYTYQLSDKNIVGAELWFKFIPKAGTRRDGGAEYKVSTGTWRFDNIRLVGMSPSQVGSPINKLHYFLFHKDNPDIVVTGSVAYEEASSLVLNLAKGSYSTFFVSNESAHDLLLPESPTLSNFYVGNTFANSNADIFGYVGDLEVSEDSEIEIRLQRLFSQVKFEFTDAADLSVVEKIGISQQHDPFFYAPFSPQLANPILDQSDVEIAADFNTNKQLIFNQFMGIHTTAVPLKYEVVLYGATGVLRTFQVESTLRNNMQLVFRGNLLQQLNVDGKFQIFKQMDWKGNKEEGF
ncbi:MULTISPECIES: hypothetical protein [Sphingobacterium]|uniref:hypothetical protein n=1 Tax=Sphingobacterium TaxID=28453 RepID=UPI0013DB1F89|nr:MULTISPECIES: hypothetical protein [unclassified Sphingobacterium]